MLHITIKKQLFLVQVGLCHLSFLSFYQFVNRKIDAIFYLWLARLRFYHLIGVLDSLIKLLSMLEICGKQQTASVEENNIPVIFILA